MALVVSALGLVLGAGLVVVPLALAVALVGAAWAYLRSEAVVLAVSRAEPADPGDHARLHNLVEGLCSAAGLPKPRLHVIDDAAPNAFATGRDPRHAALAVTTGLLERLDRVELEGVLAHELSHIKSHDTLVSTLSVTVVGGLPLLAQAVLRSPRRGAGGDPEGPAPLVARAVQAVVGPEGEARADLAAVGLTRYPPGLATALEELRAHGTAVRSATSATAHLWIAPPLAGGGPDGGRGVEPSLAERIDVLREL